MDLGGSRLAAGRLVAALPLSILLRSGEQASLELAWGFEVGIVFGLSWVYPATRIALTNFLLGSTRLDDEERRFNRTELAPL